MPNPDYQNRNPLVLDVADQPIIAYPIPPQPASIAVERLAQLSRVVSSLHPFPQKPNDLLPVPFD